jgi:hypothetical protein
MKFNLKIPFLLGVILQVTSYTYCQDPFDHCKFLEEFFSDVRYKEIPYFQPSIEKPLVQVSEARDTAVEVFDTETYESRCINEVELINQRWNDYNQVQQFIENRDIKKNSFHLVRTNVNMKELSYIRNELATRLDENFIDSSQLYVVDNPHKCEVFKKYSDQNFLFDKSIESLSEQEKYNMRGYFRFGPILMTNDRKYAIMTYDIYHKWISSNGQHTNMETGGGGIVIVNLTGGQNIERYLHCWEY